MLLTNNFKAEAKKLQRRELRQSNAFSAGVGSLMEMKSNNSTKLRQDFAVRNSALASPA